MECTANLRPEITQHIRALTDSHHAHLYLRWPLRQNRTAGKPNRVVAANTQCTTRVVEWQPYGAVAGRVCFSEYYRFSLGVKVVKGWTSEVQPSTDNTAGPCDHRAPRWPCRQRTGADLSTPASSNASRWRSVVCRSWSLDTRMD